MACKDISGIGLASIAAMVIMTALPAAAASDASLSDLQNLISSFDDSILKKTCGCRDSNPGYGLGKPMS